VEFILDTIGDLPKRFQPASIDIMDDSTDEADNQFFLAHLQLLSATRPELINLSVMNTRNCTITDNDSEFFKLFIYFCKLIFYLISDVSISFEFPSYTFMEPENRTENRDEVFLVRNILSERTFSFVVRPTGESSNFSSANIRDNSGRSYDFDLLPEGSSNGTVLTLTPSVARVPLNFIVRPDTIPEGSEALTVNASSAPGFPTLPATSTLIIITDNDSEF